jgi:NAD(P)-dependent dehydrogenase (short-subunit alcohol dehydrogenase family)
MAARHTSRRARLAGATKTDKHPHTNMAKAALNMMTRTSAPDFVKDGIHMNAVDTGW